MPSFPAQTFDSFADPYTRPADESSLDEIRSHIRSLEQQHKQNGIMLTGRIIHVCHYLPIVATYKSGNDGLPSPPATPTARAVEFSPHENSENPISLVSTNATPLENRNTILGSTPTTWRLAPRFGYAATISGIRSLSMTHEQVIVGWTGDIECTGPAEKVPAKDISMEDRIAFEEALKSYTPKESDPDDDKRTTYVPVWLDDKVAHGHYDGYCKQSTSGYHSSYNLKCTSKFPTALWPLFHYLLWQDVATEYASADQHYAPYESVNAAFAQRIAEIYQPGDLIWVHDYHLLLVPKYVVYIAMTNYLILLLD